MKTLTIEVKSGKKGRVFSGAVLAHVCADALWEGGRTETDGTRPVWVVLGGEETTLRPFVANFRDGAVAVEDGRGWGRRRSSNKWALLKSYPFKQIHQRTGVGTLTTLYLAPLFELDPGHIPSVIGFVAAMGGAWAKVQTLPAMPEFNQWYAQSGFSGEKRPLSFTSPLGVLPMIPRDVVRGWSVEASLFRAYLERRTTLPLPADPLFTLHLYVAMLAIGAASLPETSESSNTYRRPDVSAEGDVMLWARHPRHGFRTDGTEALGVERLMACYLQHEEFQRIASQEVQRYRQMLK